MCVSRSTGSALEPQCDTTDLDSRYDPLPRLGEVLEDPQADVFDVESAGDVAVNTDAGRENHTGTNPDPSTDTGASRGGAALCKAEKTLQSICQRSQMKLREADRQTRGSNMTTESTVLHPETLIPHTHTHTRLLLHTDSVCQSLTLTLLQHWQQERHASVQHTDTHCPQLNKTSILTSKNITEMKLIIL